MSELQGLSTPGHGAGAPTPTPPDEKDWTWVLDAPCPECGFDASELDMADLGARIRAAVGVLGAAAVRPGGRVRPVPATWSPLEYACHVRDACTVFAGRARAVAATDGARFANWDQDDAALAGRYWEQDPTAVRAELLAAAEDVVAAFGGFGGFEGFGGSDHAAGSHGSGGSAWQHRGVRSNGSQFTGDTLARYFLHDLVHHAHDVAGPADGTGS